MGQQGQQAKHTAERWRVCNINETMVLDAEGNEVAEVKGDYDADYERMAARARLIASAPELLEALSAIVADLAQIGGVHWKTLDCAKTVIAKATEAA